ncbi:MAG TPA: MBL fold metallo-hydrolase, partial [Acidimicrobiales bacterium]|nr:MBL fold metallo-hydrolase [Acidimicrobiales bacterium]
MRAETTRIAPGIVQIDTLLGGWERVTAGYLVEGDSPVLVETGSQSSVPVLLEALAALGLSASDLAGVAVTHIHLDHAGGVGDVARAFPAATVYVHEKGARHLVDPTRLVDSASRVYGPLLDSLYGRLDPTPAERIKVLADGEELEVSANRRLTTVDS